MFVANDSEDIELILFYNKYISKNPIQFYRPLENEKENCSICLSSLYPNSVVCALPCSHKFQKFHIKCIVNVKKLS